jgi:uncharacterized protein
MTQPARSTEPSMEEILASIRRIIADDDASKSTQQVPEPAKPPAPVIVPAAPPPRPTVAAPAPVPPPERHPVEDAIPPAMMNGDSDELPEPADVDEQPVELDEQPADILELTESMTAPMPSPAPRFRTIDSNPDVGFDEAAEKPSAKPAREPLSALLSAETTAAVDSAFNTLAQTVLVQNARTLEDLVREMLRPMLKTWLDENLPGMVERMVRSEIERVSRGR